MPVRTGELLKVFESRINVIISMQWKDCSGWLMESIQVGEEIGAG